jgi:hypothetical protein
MVRHSALSFAVVGVLLLMTVTLVGSSPAGRSEDRGARGPEVAAPGTHVSISPAASASGPVAAGNGVFVGTSLKNDRSPALRTIPPRPVRALPADEDQGGGDSTPAPAAPQVRDPVVQSVPAAPAMPATTLNFEGIDFPGVSCNCAPPDTNGEPGATQYVQIVNDGYQVFSKTTGASVFGPVDIATIWSGFGGACENNGDGDPVLLYDQFANRWLVSQFAGPSIPTDECIAISTTSDATGAFNRYDFHLGTSFFDYPKIAVWPDGYYMADNVFDANSKMYKGPQPFVFDRTKMLAGQVATFQTLAGPLGNSLAPIIPADIDGSTLPPANAPETFVKFPSSGTYVTYHYHVDWGTPANTTWTTSASPVAAPFTVLCGSTRACVPQLSSSDNLDALADRLMFRLAYRNFGDHESVVGNYSVSSSGVAGVRWFELRNVTSGPETVFQESTYQPDSTYRWMGSAAMDHNGDIAVGFSASSSSIFPQLRYAGRLSTDPLNTLGQGEATLFSGAGSQTGTSNRWGDYSDMTIDPVDDCTFWYTNEYYSTTDVFSWHTRIGSFVLPGCGSGGDLTPPSVSSFAPTTASPTNALTISYGLTFSESVTGLTAGDFSRTGTATGCAVGAPSGSGASYTVAVTGCSEGSVILTLNSGTVTDLATNAGPTSPSTASTVTIDRTGPTASLTPPASPTNATTLSYTATFNESVTGVAAGDFAVTGTATGCVVGAPSGSGASRTVALTSCSAGTVVLTLKSGSVADAAGNPGPASDVAATSVTIDRTAPTATLTPPVSPTSAATLTYGVGFDESVTGLAAGDFTHTGTATGCTVAAPSGSAASYTVDVTGCSDGTVVLALKAGTVSDLAGNPGPASDVTASSVLIARSGPSVTSFAPLTATPTNAATISYNLTFDESVTGLAAGDFGHTGTATGCTVGAPSGSGASYTIAVTGCSEGTLSLTLNANTVTDLASNVGPASSATASTVTIDRTAPTTGAPTASLRSAVVLVGASLPVALAWTAADTGGSGLATYDVGRSFDGAAFVVIATGVASPAFNTTTSSGHTYRFEVRAHDHAGNIGGWVAGSTLKPSLVQQTSTSISYHLTWTTSTYASYSGGTVKYATAAGASASYTFTGRGIAFVTTRAASRGAVKIYIDGVLQTTFNCYAASSTFRYVAFAKTWATSGTHTIKLVVVGTAGHPRVDLDALEVMR